jgi:hypothetical protein
MLALIELSAFAIFTPIHINNDRHSENDTAMYFKDYRDIERLKRDHEEYGNKWYPWLLKAEELLTSAQLLREQCITRKYFPNDLDKYEDEIDSPGGKVFSVILMLWAMAAECLLKALWLKSGETLIVNRRYSKLPKTNDHDLCTMAEVISSKGAFHFSDTDIDVLYHLSPFITLGRYPIQKEVTTRNRNAPKGFESAGWSLPLYDNLFGDFIDRLFRTFRT